MKHFGDFENEFLVWEIKVLKYPKFV